MQENDLTTITIGWNILCVFFYRDEFIYLMERGAWDSCHHHPPFSKFLMKMRFGKKGAWDKILQRFHVNLSTITIG
jgi:hypothetical protein